MLDRRHFLTATTLTAWVCAVSACTMYNVGSRFQSLAAGNPMQVRRENIAVKITYSWSR